MTNINTLLSTMKAGTIHTITFERVLKTRKNVNDIIKKVETLQVKLGDNYEHKAATIQGRQDGTLPTTNQGLKPNLKWIAFPYLIQNTQTSVIQLRGYGLENKVHKVEYFKNGIAVQPAQIIADCQKNEVYLTTPPVHPTFNVSVDKIVAIK